MRREALEFVVAVLVAGCILACSNPAQQRSTEVKRLTFALELDRAQAEACGWAGADEGEAEIAGRVVRLISKRMRAMEREASVAHEGLRLEVSLPSVQPRDRALLQSLLGSLGLCEFLWVAEGQDIVQEKAKLHAWRTAHPDALLAAFNALDPDQGGPPTHLLWAEAQIGNRKEPLPLRLPGSPEDTFGSACFEQVDPIQDLFGYPDIGFELQDERVADFTRVTGAHPNERLAVVLRGRLRSATSHGGPLGKKGSIGGSFDDAELQETLEALRKGHGPLRVVEAR